MIQLDYTHERRIELARQDAWKEGFKEGFINSFVESYEETFWECVREKYQQRIKAAKKELLKKLVLEGLLTHEQADREWLEIVQNSEDVEPFKTGIVYNEKS